MNFLRLLRKHVRSSDTILGIGLLFIMTLIVIPLPGYILDALIVISIFSALLIILTSMTASNPADFSVFPTLLLISTIYRLALNIATTRMILSFGSGASSKMIEVFGTFVVGGSSGAGSYVIGIIIFVTLTLVQLLVITKGSTRVSEVAARFTLDSLPGRQLAIDSDVAAGHLDQNEARKKREILQTEMSFYGAMDGASKFVQGDARFSIVMIVINILGGLIVGVSIRGESLSDALALYTRFTIGDGLVAALPSLMISTATGIIVSRSVGREALPTEIKKQLASNPTILYVISMILILAGFLPGFPFIALTGIGLLLFFLALQVDNRNELAVSAKKQTDSQEVKDDPGAKTENFMQQMKTETIELQVGYNLIPLVDKKQGGTLLDQISRLRRRFAMEQGLIIPPIRIRDNMGLEPDEYLILLYGNGLARSKVEVDRLLAIRGQRVTQDLNYPVIREPSFGLHAYWISPEDKNLAEGLEYDVVDPSTVIATNLSKIISENSSEILGRLEVKSMLDSVKEDNTVIIDELLKEKKVTIGLIQKILQNLLKEGVAIRNLVRILETIANHCESSGKDPYLLTEFVRQGLRRQIISNYLDDSKTLRVIVIDPKMELKIREAIQRDPEEGFILTLKPELLIQIREALLKQYRNALNQSVFPIFLTSRSIRAAIFSLLERVVSAKNFAVISQEETIADMKISIFATAQLTNPLKQKSKSLTEG